MRAREGVRGLGAGLTAALAALLLTACSARRVTPAPLPPPAPAPAPARPGPVPPEPGPSPEPAPGSLTGWAWPISGEVSSRFGARDHGSGWHAGVDLRAPEGATVRAAKAGTVTFSGVQGDYGKLVVLDHGDGVTSWYGHLGATKVREGQAVAQGQAVGVCGRSGNATGFHLHFEIRQDGVPFDPLPALGCVTARCAPPSP